MPWLGTVAAPVGLASTSSCGFGRSGPRAAPGMRQNVSNVPSEGDRLRSVGVPGVDPRVVRTREAVLRSARTVLLEEGWEQVTLARVARHSGYSRATLYRHWPNRLDLLKDAIREHVRLIHSVPTGDLRSDLVAELEAFRGELDSGLGHMVVAIAHQARTEASFADLNQAMRTAGTVVLHQIIRDAQRRGVLSTRLDEDAAVGLLVGPILFRYLFEQDTPEPVYVEVIVDGFLAADAEALP